MSQDSKKTENEEPETGTKSNEVGQDQVQDKVDAEEEKGYRGTTDDPGDYTVQGSVAGKNQPDAAKPDDEEAKG